MTLSSRVHFAMNVGRRIRAEGLKALPFILGRFYVVRRAYSFKRSLRSKHAPPSSGDTIFTGVTATHAITALRETAVFRPVRIPTDYVSELRAFARSQLLFVQNGPRNFRYGDVHNGKLPSGEHITLAQVSGIKEQPLAIRIAEDRVVLAAMAAYLGYMPQYEIRMYWSFVSDADLEERRRTGQTVEYHFDSYAYNFAYAAYYLTDTDEASGAHVMVIGSHKDKPTTWLFGSTRQSDEAVNARYPKNRIITICGAAGEGFWQDSSCYHKALAPTAADRLLLQVRYS